MSNLEANADLYPCSYLWGGSFICSWEQVMEVLTFLAQAPHPLKQRVPSAASHSAGWTPSPVPRAQQGSHDHVNVDVFVAVSPIGC